MGFKVIPNPNDITGGNFTVVPDDELPPHMQEMLLKVRQYKPEEKQHTGETLRFEGEEMRLPDSA